MKVVTGDLINLAETGAFDIITHGCNCFCNMGKGIAPLIKEAFPLAWEADRNTLDGYSGKLGKISVAFEITVSGFDLIVVNSYTQFNYWRRGEPRNTVHADYDAIRSCFKLIAERAVDWYPELKKEQIRIGYPKIGCGLAGGDWNIVSKIIDEELDGFDHTLVVLP